MGGCWRGLGWLFVLGVGFAILGCAGPARLWPSPPGPGVPRISDLRIVPHEVNRGARVSLAFEFSDADGDVQEVYLVLRSEIQDFTITTGIAPSLVSRGEYFGKMNGTVSVSLGALTEGVRVYEVFAVDGKGNVSNRLRARLVVR
ncbi:MAG: hypothetical protein ACE5HK_03130 [Candidatus Methylomirabilales bacterium]